MIYILLVILSVVFDLFTKAIASYAGLTILHNKGISFGLIQGRVSLISLVNLLVAAALVWFILREIKRSHDLSACGMSLLLGGTVANLAERLYLGYVTDWILCPLSSFFIRDGLYFNLADVFICAGAFLIFLYYTAGDRLTWLEKKLSI